MPNGLKLLKIIDFGSSYFIKDIEKYRAIDRGAHTYFAPELIYG